MPRPNLLAELARRPLLCDGGMGTQLMLRGLQPGACGESWNVERPADVQAIHQAYRDAGCDLLTTNTFGGTAPTLERHHLAEQVAQLNRAGAQVARRAAGESAWVLGDIGPFGGFLEPVGDMPADQLLDIFEAQAAGLKSGGADALIIETMTDPGEITVAISAGRALGDWPIIATYAFNRSEGDGAGFRTMMGTTVEAAMKAAIDAGADVVGANCGTSLSLEDYLHLAERLVKATRAASAKAAVIIQPNAGSPQLVDGKLIHPATPAEMAALVPQFLALGIRIIGGCCGTTPDHLRAMGKALKTA